MGRRWGFLFAFLFAVPLAAVEVTTPSGSKAQVFSRGELVDVLAVLQLAGIHVGFSPAAGSYVATAQEREVHFTPGGSLAVVDGELKPLPGPVRSLEGHVVASPETLSWLLGPFGFRLQPTEGGFLLAAGSPLRPLEVTVAAEGPHVLLVLQGLEHKPRVSWEEGKVTLSFPSPVQLAISPSAPGVLSGVQVQERSLTFLLQPGWQLGNAYPLENPLRFVLRLSRLEPRTAPSPTPRRGPLVVLDPGHGGEDQGARGSGGALEKNITLQIARRVAAKLQQAGVAARLTREGDETVPLLERTALANRLTADAFVSIHANAAPVRGARGAETYFMSADASDPEAAQAAARENQAVAPDVQLILWNLAHVANLEASSRLSLQLQGRLNVLSGIKDRGVKQAPFVVLTGATMPAVLVEVGFLSNPEEEARLSSSQGQEAIAQALAEGILAFLHSSQKP